MIIRCEVCDFNNLDQELQGPRNTISIRPEFSQVMCEECFQAIAENLEAITPEEDDA